MSKRNIEYSYLQSLTSAIGKDVSHSFYTDDDDSWGTGHWIVQAEPFDTVIAEGTFFFARGFEGWTDTVKVENPTIRDLIEAMQRSIESLGDYHHLFLEGYTVNRRDDGADHIIIHTGS